jgi:hypothetical protein
MLKLLFAPLMAGLFYGGWAAYSNMEYGQATAMMAGLVQAGFAFVATLLLTVCVGKLMARQHRRYALQSVTPDTESALSLAQPSLGHSALNNPAPSNPSSDQLARAHSPVALPFNRAAVVFLQTASLLAGVPGLLHLVVGTPDMLQAMLPGLIIGNCYAGGLIYRQRYAA